jgi:hypothetical protein
VFEMVKAIHEALGIESTWAFVLVIAGIFAFLSGSTAWIIDTGYKRSIHEAEARESQNLPASSLGPAQENNPSELATHEAEPATHKGTADEPRNLPLSIESRMTIDKKLTIHNYGRKVEELEMQLTAYHLDEDAFLRGIIKVASFSQYSGSSWIGSETLGYRCDTKPLDMLAIKFLNFREFPKDAGTDIKPFLDYYALRFTFRDPKTGIRYAAYRVTSTVKGNPTTPDDPRYVARAGPAGSRIFTDDIPKVIEDHQRGLFSTRGDRDYVLGTP